MRPFQLSRRTVLRGLGATMALPWLECMGAPSSGPPPRYGMFYFGTGMNMDELEPKDFGKDYTLSPSLKPLEDHRDYFTLVSGTYLKEGGGHDGAYPFSTSIARGKKQILSPDQIVARKIGGDTRFPSLQMAVVKGTGYGGQPLNTVSWNEQGVPLSAENDPKVLFDRLFRPDNPNLKQSEKHEFRQRRSVLDIVGEQAKSMERKLGKTDKEQLDQYFSSVREMEKKLERDVAWSDRPKPEPDLSGYLSYEKSIHDGLPNFKYDTYAKLMYDLIALAFQTDSTRVVSYVVRRELSGGVYPEFGVSKGYHALTHHGNDIKNLNELGKVDRIYMGHWAYFLKRLRSIREGDATLLDHTVLGFSSGMGMGHSKNRLPTVISGGSALGINHQGHLKMEKEVPLSALWQTMVERCGANPGEQFQDSPGVIGALVS